MNSESLLGMSGHSQPDKQVVSGLDCMCIGDRHKKMKAFLCERAQNNNSAEQMYCNLGPVYPQCTERNAAGVSVHGQFDLVSACCMSTCIHLPMRLYAVTFKILCSRTTSCDDLRQNMLFLPYFKKDENVFDQVSRKSILTLSIWVDVLFLLPRIVRKKTQT